MGFEIFINDNGSDTRTRFDILNNKLASKIRNEMEKIQYDNEFWEAIKEILDAEAR